MVINMLRSKLHRAAVTSCEIDYEGSCRIDPDMLRLAGMVPHEWCHIWNVTNGERFETYVIEGKAGSREVCVNGAAARLCEPGDRVIIATTCTMSPAEALDYQPTVVLLDEHNREVT